MIIHLYAENERSSVASLLFRLFEVKEGEGSFACKIDEKTIKKERTAL